jgi:hypothetical protein
MPSARAVKITVEISTFHPKPVDPLTDIDVLCQVLACIDPSAGRLYPIRRNGRLLLAFQSDRASASRTLGLYQPQRPAARLVAASLRLLVGAGAHAWMPAHRNLTTLRRKEMIPPLTDVIPGTCGVMLGSPEHRIRRAIATYRTDAGWEVGKLAFGADGSDLLTQEANVLRTLATKTHGVPKCLGLHHEGGISMLRMPYLTGAPVRTGESTAALALLEDWISDRPPQPMEQYAEWQFISKALAASDAGESAFRQLKEIQLVPVICHGDFARWNLLKQDDGTLIVLDWEWGRENGMPGIDLVHYFLQDARLVKRMPDKEAVSATIDKLRQRECLAYLEKTGWGENPLLPIIACLAYKQGSEQQESHQVLQAALTLAI